MIKVTNALFFSLGFALLAKAEEVASETQV